MKRALVAIVAWIFGEFMSHNRQVKETIATKPKKSDKLPKRKYRARYFLTCCDVEVEEEGWQPKMCPYCGKIHSMEYFGRVYIKREEI